MRISTGLVALSSIASVTAAIFPYRTNPYIPAIPNPRRVPRGPQGSGGFLSGGTLGSGGSGTSDTSSSASASPSAVYVESAPASSSAAALVAASSSTSASAAASTSTSTACNNSPLLCDKSYGDVVHLGAHDSAFVRNASTGNTLSGNQYYDIEDALSYGVRLLSAQAHDLNGALELCHTSCDLLDAGSLESWLSTVTGWLDSNPNEGMFLCNT
jgi:hypothetical protein